CYYFQNDEVIAFASERAPLLTVFDAAVDDVKEVQPGHVMVIKKRGTVSSTAFRAPLPRTSCSFERIYFSRGNDFDIYEERDALCTLLTVLVLEAVDDGWSNTLFSFIAITV